MDQENSGIAAPQRRIIVAEAVGFCFGVRRAVDMTEASRRTSTGNVTTLGALAHNNQVLMRMRSEGIDQAQRLEDVPPGTVVLSAHGVSPEVRKRAHLRGLEVLDTTCPFVTKVHRAAKQLLEQGYQLVLVGDSGHTEVQGVIGMVESLGGTLSVVASPEEASSLRLSKKVGLICQTTQYASTFGAVVAAVCRKVPDVRAINTICGATDTLQEAALKLAREVDVVLVIGGKNSANTRRLRELCEKEGVPSYHIETTAEIQPEWLEGKQTIGLTAGASTPDQSIEEVAKFLNGGALPADWRLLHPDA